MPPKKLVEPARRRFRRKPKILDSPHLVKTESKVADDPPPSAEDNQRAAEQSPAPRPSKEESEVANDPEPPPGEVDQAATESSTAPLDDNSTLSTAGQAIKTALTVLKECLDGVPVPGLKAAVGGILEVVKIYGNVTGNQEELVRLKNRITRLTAKFEQFPERLPNGQLPASLQSDANDFVSTLKAKAAEAERISGRSWANRTAKHEAYKELIQNLNTEIDRIIATSTMETSRRIESKIDVEHMKYQASEDEKLIVGMPHTHARYDDTSTKPSRACHPNTRTDLRQTIGNWIDEPSPEQTLFWLCGEVGVGKTTVAHTIAQERDDLNQLGASFFFNRDHPQRRNSLLFAPTIAYQLARFDLEAYQALVGALRRNPDIVHRNLQQQFSQLVVQPLTCIIKSSSQTILIVVDGLDECDDPVAILDVLPLLTRSSGSRLRVLITSRPHAAIVTKFKSTRLCHLTSQRHFRNINSQTLSNDVEAYLEWSLGEIASEFQHSLPSPWPIAGQSEKLVDMASGLFIIASLFVIYIRNPVEGNPSVQLERILSRGRAVGRSPTAELDSMYDLVLEDIKRPLSGKHVDLARNLLQLTFLSSKGMSVREIADVLGLTGADVLSVLRHGTSVLHLPDGDNGYIIPFHASFGEYIQDPERCSVKELVIEPGPSHAELVGKFFEVFIRAAGGRTNSIEYDFWNPPPEDLDIADRELCHHIYLASDPAPPPCRQVEDKLAKDAVLIWLFIRYWVHSSDTEDRVVVERIKKAGFAIACHIKDEASMQLLMVKRILDEMRHLSIRHPVPNDCSNDATYEHSRIADEADLQQFKIKLQWQSAYWWLHREDPRYFARMLWKWSKLQHSNIVPLRGVDFGSLLEFSERPTIYIPSTSNYPDLRCNWYPDLLDAFWENSTRAVQTALGIACALQYLLESGFYRSSMSTYGSHFRIEDLVLSREGTVMVHPTFLVYKDSVDLSPTDAERQSLSKRGLTRWYFHGSDEPAKIVWEFGCVLYEMMTGVPPLKRYDDLVSGSKRIDDGTTVRHLLDDLQAPEDLKGVLKACWGVHENKPSHIQAIVARLETVFEGLRNGGPGAVEDD